MTTMTEFFTNPDVVSQFGVMVKDMPFAAWETIYSTFLATVFAYALGLPLGVLLVVGEQGGIRPLPRPLMKVLNAVINLLRSVPFLIMVMMAIPLTRLILHTSVGTMASVVPLVIAAFPFVARLVESSLREVDTGILEAAQSMGASPLQIIWMVMLPESLPSLISGFTIALTTILGYGAMAGILGGGGLGAMAINNGYYRSRFLIMYAAVILLVLLVQVFQSVGTRLSVKCDKRITKTKRKKEKY